MDYEDIEQVVYDPDPVTSSLELNDKVNELVDRVNALTKMVESMR